MKDIILCSSNPMLVKSLYGILRDAGTLVETVEHPSIAVQKIIARKYDAVIIDSDPFGLSAEDATEIIRRVAPEIQILLVGTARNSRQAEAVDLEVFKRVIHAIAQTA